MCRTAIEVATPRIYLTGLLLGAMPEKMKDMLCHSHTHATLFTPTIWTNP